MLVNEADGDSQVHHSIRALADRDLSFEIACPGHGDPIATGGAEALAALASK